MITLHLPNPLKEPQTRPNPFYRTPQFTEIPAGNGPCSPSFKVTSASCPLEAKGKNPIPLESLGYYTIYYTLYYIRYILCSILYPILYYGGQSRSGPNQSLVDPSIASTTMLGATKLFFGVGPLTSLYRIHNLGPTRPHKHKEPTFWS